MLLISKAVSPSSNEEGSAASFWSLTASGVYCTYCIVLSCTNSDARVVKINLTTGRAAQCGGVCSSVSRRLAERRPSGRPHPSVLGVD